MNFIKNIFKGISKKRTISIFLLLQFIVCYHISLKTYTNYKTMTLPIERCKRVFNIDKTYTIKDNKINGDILNYSEKEELFQKIKKLDYIEAVGSCVFREESKGPLYNDSFYISNDMVNIMDLKVKDGRILTKNDFVDNAKITPVLVGNKMLQKLNASIGDEIKINDYDIEHTIKVVGVLKEGQEFFKGNLEYTPLISLDKVIICPRNVNEIAVINSYNNNYLRVSNINNDDIKADVNKISKDLNQPVSIDTVRETIKKSEGESFQFFEAYLRIDICIIIFSLFGVAVTLIMIVNTRKKEFGIRIATGSTKAYLCTMILCEVVMLNVIGMIVGMLLEIKDDIKIINVFIGQGIFEFFNLKIIGITILISVVLIGIFSLSAVRQLFKMEPRELIKGSD